MTSATIDPRTGPWTITDVLAETRPGTKTDAIRFAAALAEQYLDEGRTPSWQSDPSEFDDAPRDRDVPPGYRDDEDEGVFGDDERDLAPPQSSWIPWVRLSFFLRGKQLDYRVNLPEADSVELGVSLGYLEKAWDENAQMLLASMPETLCCTSPLEALHTMPVVTAMRMMPVKQSVADANGKNKQEAVKEPVLDRSGMPVLDKDGNPKLAIVKELQMVSGQVAMERSTGQYSRDRTVVIRTPFGLAPWWFFAQGRNDNLHSDLEQLGKAMIANNWTEPTRDMVEEVVRQSSIKPDSIRRTHGLTLVAVVRHPEVVARHRRLWPLTTIDDFLSDLQAHSTGSVGKSQGVATLALVGAFDPPAPTVTAWQPRRES